jgi:hypothetical protein
MVAHSLFAQVPGRSIFEGEDYNRADILAAEKGRINNEELKMIIIAFDKMHPMCSLQSVSISSASSQRSDVKAIKLNLKYDSPSLSPFKNWNQEGLHIIIYAKFEIISKFMESNDLNITLGTPSFNDSTRVLMGKDEAISLVRSAVGNYLKRQYYGEKYNIKLFKSY